MDGAFPMLYMPDRDKSGREVESRTCSVSDLPGFKLLNRYYFPELFNSQIKSLK